MTTYSTKSKFFWIFFFLLHALYPQDDLVIFFQPQVALNYRVADDYSHNFTLGNRSFILRDESFDLRVRQLDLSHFSNFTIRDNQSIGLGLLWRNSELFDSGRVNEFRITQQYNITHGNQKYRFGHRLRSEQRLTTEGDIFRFRYRLAVDFPLEGEKLDVGESYTLWSIENLLSAAAEERPVYGFRLRGGIGWRLSPKSKLQFALEYRLQNFTLVAQDVILFESALNLGL